MQIADWWRYLRDAGELNRGGETTVQSYARRRSILSTEARLRSVLYRSLFELHRLENEDNNKFTTFDLYVNTQNGHVKVRNLDAYGPLGSPYHPPEVFSLFLNRKRFGKVPTFASCKSRSWAYGLILCNLLGASPPWSLSEKRGEERNMLLKILDIAINHKTESLVDIFFSAELFQSISPGLTDLVRECLWVDPIRRASIRELLNHPYFRKVRTSHVIGKKWKKVPTLEFLDSLDDNIRSNNNNNNQSRNIKDHDNNISSSRIGTRSKSNNNSNNKNKIPNVLQLPSRLIIHSSSSSRSSSSNSISSNRNDYENINKQSRNVSIKRIADLKRIKPKHEDSLLHTLQQGENVSPIHDVEIYKTKFLPKLSYCMVKYQVPVPLRRLCWLMALGVDEHLAECTYSAYRRKADYERSTKAHSSRIKKFNTTIK